MESFAGDISMMMQSAGSALVTLLDPQRLMFLALGCGLGLIFGIIPGIGGLTGTAMLLPFTYALDPFSAFALLLGLGATTSTGDPIPAVLFGVPGGAASAATVLDGHPMARRGEAGRALSAAYMSSLMGGIFGALLLAFSIPILRPVLVHFGSPELLAFSVLGISMVAVLSGNAPLRGLTVACFGILIAMVGSDPHTGTFRWTLDTIYLWEGIPLVPLLLGLFALPELCDLLIARSAVAQKISKREIFKGQWQGVRDCLSHWWLILRCSWIGGGIGSIPGISAAVVDWLAYGHALRTEKGAKETFGKGDVRGVIASESSNNAKEGGALVPTLAFGVPGSATMAILLSAFLVHGLVPGPDMLTKHLDVTYAMVWSVALANILGAGACYIFSPQFAKLASLRYSLILPAVLGIVYIGAFEASRNWADLILLLVFGVLGWTMKRCHWPRAPLILGVVLGDSIERYLSISIERYGYEWLTRPVVVILFALSIYGVVRPLWQDMRGRGGMKGLFQGFGRPAFAAEQLLPIFFLALISVMMLQAIPWPTTAKTVPVVVGSIALGAAALSLLNQMLQRNSIGRSTGSSSPAGGISSIHMDIVADDELPRATVLGRAVRFFGYLIGSMALIPVIGFVPTIAAFVVLFMRIEGRERWTIVAPYALILSAFVIIVFDKFMSIPWPPSILGQMLPMLRIIPSV